MNSPDDPSDRVEVADRQTLLRIDPRAIDSLVRFALAAEGARGAVEVAFVDDETIAGLHDRFLGIPGPTDVITFPADDEPAPDERDGAALGEIVVSTDTAARQAPEYGLDPLDETYLYVIHGVLHLLGYDDHDDDDADRMAVRQRELLDAWIDGGGE